MTDLSPEAIRSAVFVRTVMLMLPASLSDALMVEADNLVQATGFSAQRLALAEALQRVESMAKARDISHVEACLLRADFESVASAKVCDASQPIEKGVLPMAYVDYDDPAHDADMRALRLEQLRADISPEEAEQEAGWPARADDEDDDQ